MAKHMALAAVFVCWTACVNRAPAPVAAPAVAPAPPPPPGPPGGRPLVVSIVVDQLAAWIADERFPQLPEDGGFARLRREGLYVEDLRFTHAVTDTAPGHAALYTGRVPRESAIVANETLAGPGQPARSILADDQAKEVGATAGKLDHPGSSLARLPPEVETVADRFVAEVAGAQVFSFSLKDRGALFAAGRRAELALWLDPELGELVTSSFFPPPPAWVAAAAGKDAVTALAREGWALDGLELAWVQGHAETPDAQEGEGDYAGLGVTFPHAIGSAKALRATPLGDRLLFGLARAAVDAARANQRPTLLALSLSAHDYVAHVFGPHSWEAWDELYRLDRALGEFLSFLDRSVGPMGYSVILTADHGSAALPELSETAKDPWCAAVQRAGDSRDRAGGSQDRAGGSQDREGGSQDRAGGSRDRTGGSQDRAGGSQDRAGGSQDRAGGSQDRWQRGCGRRHRIVPRDLLPELEKAANGALGRGRPPEQKWIAGLAEPYLYLSPKARALSAADRTRLLHALASVLRPAGIQHVIDPHQSTAPCSHDGTEPNDLICRATRSDSDGDLYLLVDRGVFFDPALAVGKGASHGSPYLYDRAVPLLVRAPGRVAAGQVDQAPTSFATFTKTLTSLLGVRPLPSDWGGEDLTARATVAP